MRAGRSSSLLLAAHLAWAAAPPAPAPGPAAFFHSPHDVIAACALSPDYERDRTLFVAAPRFQILLRSTDGGDTFEPVNAGLRTALVDLIAISPAFAEDRTLYCAEPRGVFRSSDAGDTWRALDLPEGVVGASGLAVTESGALVLSPKKTAGLWRREDDGQGWVRPKQPNPPAQVKQLVSSASGRRVGALTTDSRLLLSADGGHSFTERRLIGIPDPRTLLVDDQTVHLWVGSGKGGVFRSTDRGDTWEPINEGLRDLSVQDLALAWVGEQPSLLAATREAGVFVRLGDRDWTLLADGMRENSVQTNTHFRSIRVTPRRSRDGAVFAGTFQGLHRLDGGTWTHLDTLPGTLVRNLALSPTVGRDGRFFLSSYGHGLLATDDLGRSFRQIDSEGVGYPDGVGVAGDGTLAMGRPGGLLMSTDEGRSWQNRPTTARGFPRVITFAPDYAESGMMFAYTSISGVPDWHGFFRTTDRGVTWSEVGPPSVACIEYADDFAQSGRMWIGTKTKLWTSVDRGVTWTVLGEFPGEVVKDLSSRARDGGYELFAVLTDPGATRLLRSSDGGVTFAPCGEGLEGHFLHFVAHAGDGEAFVATRSRGVLVSRDGGCGWEPTGPGPRSVFSLAVSEGYDQDRIVVAGTYDGVWVSEDGGGAWRLCRAEATEPGEGGDASAEGEDVGGDPTTPDPGGDGSEGGR